MEGFFAMGGYGAFVWPAYVLTALVMGGFWLDSLWRLRRRQRALTRLQADLSRDRGAADGGSQP